MWRWPPLRRRDLPAALVFMLLAGIAIAYLMFLQKRSVNWGFGPAWRCSEIGVPAVGVDAVCVKNVKPMPSR
jgi:hypothetical protein